MVCCACSKEWPRMGVWWQSSSPELIKPCFQDSIITYLPDFGWVNLFPGEFAEDVRRLLLLVGVPVEIVFLFEGDT